MQRFIDRRAGGRDGRSRIPAYPGQPEPTPYIQELIAEFTEQAVAEHESLERDTASWRQDLAKLTDDIGIAQDPRVRALRQRRTNQKRRRLAAAIESRCRQYSDRRNQLAAHTWVRIGTYWTRLVQVHPDGELLNGWTNEWTQEQLVGLLEKLIKMDEPSKLIAPPEIN